MKVSQEKIIHVMEQLEPILTHMMKSAKIPGISLIVVNHEKILYSKGFGLKDKENGEYMATNAIGMIGSCSKSYAALSVLKLVSEGEVDLEAPIEKYIPVTLGKPQSPILVKHLLTHSAGIPNLGMSEMVIQTYLNKSKEDNPFSNFTDFYKHLNNAQEELYSKPGEEFIYSNTGYTLLAEIIKSVTGSPYEVYVKENIFAPLKMVRSCFTLEELKDYSNIMTEYNDEGDPTGIYHAPIIAGCGGILSTAEDQGKYLQFMLNRGQIDRTVIVPKEYIEEMEQPRTHSNKAMEYFGKGFGPEAYGYGWIIFDDFCGVKVINHGGSTGIGSASLMYSNDLDIGIGGIANNAIGEGLLGLFNFMVIAAIQGQNPMSYFPYFKYDNILNSMQGRYEGYKGIVKVEIKHRNGYLTWRSADENQNSEKNEMIMIPCHENYFPTDFWMYNGPGAKTLVRFNQDENQCWHLLRERNFLHRRANL